MESTTNTVKINQLAPQFETKAYHAGKETKVKLKKTDFLVSKKRTNRAKSSNCT